MLILSQCNLGPIFESLILGWGVGLPLGLAALSISRRCLRRGTPQSLRSARITGCSSIAFGVGGFLFVFGHELRFIPSDIRRAEFNPLTCLWNYLLIIAMFYAPAIFFAVILLPAWP